MSKYDDAPVLPAYLFHGESMGQPADYYVVWCKFCCQVHRHTAGDGHRKAHCFWHGTESPYNETGYVLEQAGEVRSVDEVVPPDVRARRTRDQFGRKPRRSGR